jgi:hypothetical protein
MRSYWDLPHYAHSELYFLGQTAATNEPVIAHPGFPATFSAAIIDQNDAIRLKEWINQFQRA